MLSHVCICFTWCVLACSQYIAGTDALQHSGDVISWFVLQHEAMVCTCDVLFLPGGAKPYWLAIHCNQLDCWRPGSTAATSKTTNNPYPGGAQHLDQKQQRS
ncbi:hypothetical protein COO60DRAFT_1515656 [Scenedesmus sp. NREL 46B-D3]|nr:hypothetical protein COO60DRAFT_1515656 [Scenedesmus sp. NREL 46B-D3]